MFTRVSVCLCAFFVLVRDIITTQSVHDLLDTSQTFMFENKLLVF